MVTRQNPQEGARRPLFIDEWMAELGLTDRKLANRLGIDKNSFYRWRVEQHRINTEKMLALADAMGIAARDLLAAPGRSGVEAALRAADERPPPARPSHRSVDALLADATDDQIDDTIAFVEKYVLKSKSTR